jgi:hypothetical protein
MGVEAARRLAVWAVRRRGKGIFVLSCLVFWSFGWMIGLFGDDLEWFDAMESRMVMEDGVVG